MPSVDLMSALGFGDDVVAGDGAGGEAMSVEEEVAVMHDHEPRNCSHSSSSGSNSHHAHGDGSWDCDSSSSSSEENHSSVGWIIMTVGIVLLAVAILALVLYNSKHFSHVQSLNRS